MGPMVGEVHRAAAVDDVLYVSAQTQRIRAAGRVNQQIELGELVVVASDKVRLKFFVYRGPCQSLADS